MAESDNTPCKVCVNCAGIFIGRYCKPCKKVRDAKGFQKNKAKRSKTAEAYRQNNKDKIKAIDAAYYSKNRDRLDEKAKQYRIDNIARCRELARASSKKHRSKEPLVYRAKVKAYESKNKEKIAAVRSAHRKAKRLSDPVFYLQTSIRNRINESIKRKGFTKRSSTYATLGCDWEFFKTHIERQFTPRMCWEKMGSEIHLDHIVPISTAATEDDVVALNHFTNLRPMWAKDNQSKGATITHLL